VALRRTVLIATVLFVLGAGWSWFRDSSLVRVQHVTVTGVSSSEGPAVRRALTDAAKQMGTLHVRKDVLEDAVAPYSSVLSIHTQRDFPHGLAIEVTERRPVALVQVGGARIPVGAGGRLMEGVKPKGDLPVLQAERLGSDGKLTDPKALAAVDALAAAPERLRLRVSKVYEGDRGLTMDVKDGPQLFFGADSRLRAKWMATARVLAEPSAAGAVYLDVRIPERVAAGGLGTLPENANDPLGSNPQLQP